ncbi:DNA glycosylase, partial [Heliocybe sulcata]
SPGYMSANTGHHFANPTNHFWKCLHLSGFTPSLLSPSRDFTLPAEYNIGLTNLVHRPSMEQAELSAAEMAASVPSLLDKIRKWQPRVVCFVGRGIWLCSTKKKGVEKSKDEGYCLQPYKVIHPEQGERRLCETFFFVVPSTSGRVVSHQLLDKVKLFTTLHDLVEEVKTGKFDTHSFAIVTLPKPEDMPEVPPDSFATSLLAMDGIKDEAEDVA